MGKTKKPAKSKPSLAPSPGSPEFQQVAKAAKALTAAEQWRLRSLLDIWLDPGPYPRTEEEFEREMVRKGLLEVPPPITDLTPYQNRTLIKVKGMLVSQTIIEERR